MKETKPPVKKKKKRRRRFRKSLLIIPLLIIAAVYAAIRVPKEMTSKKLRELGYEKEDIAAIEEQNLTDLILDNGYYSEHLASVIGSRTLVKEYIPLYLATGPERNLDDFDFLLYSRLKDQGYEEDQLMNLFASLTPREMVPLLIFDYQWNEQNYIDDCILNRPESTAETVALAGSYHTNYRMTQEAEDPGNVTVLVNKNYYLKEDFVPENLTYITTEYAVENMRLAKPAADAALSMCMQGLADGYAFFVTGSYLDYSSIDASYRLFTATKSEEEADLLIGKAGFSEYQTGLAINLAATFEKYEDFSTTECYGWLKENAARFGFIERYRAGSEYITFCEADPSYYRYVGAELAGRVKASGYTYDEYYCLLLKGWYDEANKPSDSIMEKAAAIVNHEE